MPVDGTIAAQDAAYCIGQLREHAPDLYFACLLLPESIRPAVSALHAFHAEITGVTLSASEPITGEIRLQWWMDVLNGDRDEEAFQNPLARSLLTVIRENQLPAKVLVRKLEAHIFDLYCDPMGDRAMLEGYLGETRSVIFQLASLIADADQAPAVSDASGHAGVAMGYAAILENLARHRSQQKIFVPSDMLAGCGMTNEVFLSDEGSRNTKLILALVDAAEDHWERARDALRAVNSDSGPVFAPLAVVPTYLSRIKKSPEKAFTGLPPVSQLRRQWALWRW